MLWSGSQIQIYRFDEPDGPGFAPPPLKVSQFEHKASIVGIWDENLYSNGRAPRTPNLRIAEYVSMVRVAVRNLLLVCVPR